MSWYLLRRFLVAPGNIYPATVSTTGTLILINLRFEGQVKDFSGEKEGKRSPTSVEKTELGRESIPNGTLFKDSTTPSNETNT